MKIYYKENGRLKSKIVNIESVSNKGVAQDLSEIGIVAARRAVGADKDSPVLAIAK